MGMRIGILLGFLGGAIAKTVAGKPDATSSGPIGKARAHVQEAIQAGKQAAQEKEDEMRRDFERTTHRPDK